MENLRNFIGSRAGMDRRARWVGAWIVLLVVAAAVQATPTQAATYYVANNGLDSSPCTKTMPCRSITRALSVAPAGSKIEVGPGVYGDIDGSGTVGDSVGEETPSPPCMILITKSVTLVSKDGARSTVLDDPSVGTAVCIFTAGASGTVFGKLGKGFTIRSTLPGPPSGFGGTGLRINEAEGVKVQGNIATGVQAIGSIGFSGEAKGATLKSNIATDHEYGFYLTGSEGLVLTGNLANRNVGVGMPGLGVGFFLELRQGESVTKNTAIANLHGFSISADSWSSFTFAKNTALGNGVGMVIDTAPLSGPVAVTLGKNNNFFGNGDRGLAPPFGPNCGLVIRNLRYAPPNPVTVNATGSFWGAATGPG